MCERLCGVLGYSYDERMLDLTRIDHHTIGGNKIRFRPVGRIAEDAVWQDRLSSGDLGTVTRVCAPAAKKLGYEV
jgi:hypothetical protein